jgi:hypothetical protein
VRREVLKRVSEFEDFSSCWDNDRYKAQGLVAQIQKLVNIKDSFTRINLERERERKRHQAVHTAMVQAKQKEAQERAAIKDALYKLFTESNPYVRGKQLEAVLNSLFSFAGFLVTDSAAAERTPQYRRRRKWYRRNRGPGVVVQKRSGGASRPTDAPTHLVYCLSKTRI